MNLFFTKYKLDINKYRCKKAVVFFVLVFAMFSFHEVSAQFKCTIKGTILEDDNRVENATVTLYKGGTVVQQISTSANGKYSFNLEANSEYTLQITKAGRVVKKIAYSTNGMSDDIKKNFTQTLESDVSIFEMPKDPDLVSKINAIVKNPVGKITYDPVKESIGNDEGYANSVRSALSELQKLQEEAKKKEDEENRAYKAAITKGDAALAKKDYTNAKSLYTDAKTIKPFEKYPQDKLTEIDKALADTDKAVAADAKYKEAIAKGDGAMGSKDYPTAKAAYTEASGLKPNEPYPKTKLAEIDKLLADAAKAGELEAKYKTAIDKGDAAFNSKDYPSAKASYNEALGIKPKEKYPADKLKEIDKILADLANQDKAAKELNDKYNAAIAKGDKALGEKAYDKAKTAYTEASGLKPNEQYPKDKLAEIDKLLGDAAKSAEIEAKYKAAIAQGDKALAAKDYTAAKTSYIVASGLKPSEQYPKDKLAEIDKAIASAEADKDRAAKEKELNDKYNVAIAKGDFAMGTKTYDNAKAAYTEATGLKPNEKYPKDKLAEIDKLMAKDAADKELNAKYTEVIDRADAAFGKQDYITAKAAYNEALGIKPNEKYPKDKITSIDKLLADKDAKEKADKELNAKYDAAIAKGDKALAAKDYTLAKGGYNDALGLKPNEQYPKDKITEIDALIAKELGDKQLNEKYNAAIAKGDKALSAKDYISAKAGYTDALALKPNEQYPKDKLAEVEKLLTDAEAEKDRLAKEKELNDKYNAAIAKGDAALKTKDYTNAKAAYNEALGLKPNEKYPKDKIDEIDKLIAKEMGEKELNEKYNAAIAKGDAAFGTKDYTTAKAVYNEALGFKPDEKYPKNKIAEIDKLLADIDAKEKSEKELKDKYDAAIAKADKALASKTYPDAKSSYNEALGLKPNEQYPKDKIAEIDALLAKEMGEKQLEEKYKAAIAMGDEAFAKKDYTTAKAGYTDALGLKTNEQYPKDKLAEIEKLMGDAAAEQDRLAKEKELNDKYTAAIAKGDAALGAKDYTNAKAAYIEALGLKANEQYPKDKLAELDKLIAKEMSEKELNDKYNAAIAKADGAFGSKDYTNAKAEYTEALGIKPDEQYPKEKIAEINKILVDLSTKEKEDKEAAEKYNAAIAKADKELADKKYSDAKEDYTIASGFKPYEQYPIDKVKEIDDILSKEKKAKALENNYNNAIAMGDNAFAKQDYNTAKAAYQDALGFKPNEKYPQDKITEIDTLLAKEVSAKQLEENYKTAIRKADEAFSATEYNNAKKEYNNTLAIKPNEQYPKDQISKIELLLAEINKNKDLNDKYNAAIAKADAAYNSKDYTNALASYKEAQTYKPNEVYPPERISDLNKLIDDDARAKAKEQRYLAAIASADKLFDSKELKKARSTYADALLIKPIEQYPKDKMDEIDKLLKKENTVITPSTKVKDDFRNELALKYPEGVTEEYDNEGKNKIVRRIVVKNGEGHMYVQKTTSFGPIYYTRDGVPITEQEYESKTQP